MQTHELDVFQVRKTVVRELTAISHEHPGVCTNINCQTGVSPLRPCTSVGCTCLTCGCVVSE
jgi:hypothetical protein